MVTTVSMVSGQIWSVLDLQLSTDHVIRHVLTTEPSPWQLKMGQAPLNFHLVDPSHRFVVILLFPRAVMNLQALLCLERLFSDSHTLLHRCTTQRSGGQFWGEVYKALSYLVSPKHDQSDRGADWSMEDQNQKLLWYNGQSAPFWYISSFPPLATCLQIYLLSS